MDSKDTALSYVHGFSAEEQARLKHQAEFLEQKIYRDVDFSLSRHIVEVGCGVGAQSEILLRRFPRLHITGIDMSEPQLKACAENLKRAQIGEGRFAARKMDAQAMDFEGGSFDGAFLCWVLEHVPDPARVLSEVRRVLKPGARVYLTEVMNSTFFLDPYSPNVWKYWMRFNDFQYDQAGDPFIGAKLGNMLMAAGFRRVQTEVKTFHLDNREPERRRQIIEYWRNLMLSASEQLTKAGYVTATDVDAVKSEMLAIEKNPNAVFYYSFMQAIAITE